jgi:hypothetical protein
VGLRSICGPPVGCRNPHARGVDYLNATKSDVLQGHDLIFVRSGCLQCPRTQEPSSKTGRRRTLDGRTNRGLVLVTGIIMLM